ncbi:MFS transporter [Mesorhizobium sp. BAC0120]|uniref:MFS transporter n=1 Tax=Mesorhizobium sp. BAC0120 TaxID=3090670 RepID=UPI00298D3027|nr:MFS transporter [Mesorhizobium sp. BAC0120]MDW6020817.1 MFS transporter [Mesorhizobium sp. BAC0120]
MSEVISATAELETPANEGERAEPLWGAVASLSLGVFGLVTAEFLPASLLTRMAVDLNVTDGAAGQTVTATAIVGALAGLTLAIFTKSIDRRLVLWTLTLLLVLSNLLAATATGLTTLLVARVLLGIGLGGFWSMAGALTMRLVPERLVPRAMSIVLTGVSVATVTAAPLGAYVGDLWGWRAAFIIAAAVGVVALTVQILTMPKLPPVAASSFRSLIDLLKRPALRIGLIALLLVISGHFAGFTYVRPFLEKVPALNIEAISLVLLAYGIGGFFGNFTGGFVAERSIRAAVTVGALAIAVMALVMILLGSSAIVSSAAIAAWGFFFGFLPVGFQSWTVRTAPDQAEAAGGLLVTSFQIAITGGAIFGGLLLDAFGPLGVIAYSALAALLGAALVFALGKESAQES